MKLALMTDYLERELIKQVQFNKLLEPLQRDTFRRRVIYGEASGNWDTTTLGPLHTYQQQRFR